MACHGAGQRDADRDPGQWYLIIDGVAAGNGYGSPVDAGEAGRIARRSGPRCASTRFARPGSRRCGILRGLRRAVLRRHWHLSAPGTGTVPSVTARAWTRTGSQPKRTRGDARVDDDQQQQPRALIVRKTRRLAVDGRRATARPRPAVRRGAAVRGISAPPACSPGCRAWTRTG